MVLFGQGFRKLFSLGNGGNLCFSSYQADGQSLGQPDPVAAESLQKCCYVWSFHSEPKDNVHLSFQSK